MSYKTVQNVYAKFLEIVVRDHVFSPEERTRGAGHLGEQAAADVAKGKRIDGRVPYLARVSGKGGWDKDPEKRQRYARFTNVSLIDHLASVVRGAITFAWIDLSAAGAPETEIAGRLPKIAAAAFLHDLDKILRLERADRLTAAHVATGMERYGAGKFLAAFGQSLDPAMMLSAIHAAETSRAGELTQGGAILDRTFKDDLVYVRLADRLDGKFLDTSPQGGGIGGVLKELETFDAGLRSGALKGWRLVRVDDPHTPFLLEELLAGLSMECKARHGHPPLLEIHHDGRLLCLIPEKDGDALIAGALGRATRPIGAGMKMRVDVNKRGYVDILDARGTLDDLRGAFEDRMETRDREKFLQLSIDFARERAGDVAAMLAPYGGAPRFPNLDKAPGRRVAVWSGLDAGDDAMKRFHSDACRVVATLGCADPDDDLGIPDADAREEELRTVLTARGVAIPDWIAEQGNKLDRWTLLAALAAAAAAANPEFREALLGGEGLVKLWLEGDGGARPGLVAKIPESGSALAEAVTAHYRALMTGKIVRAADEAAPGRCHFTNQPVSDAAKISTKTALYGVKISAFSGRMGRPESFAAVRQETLAAPIAEAEHRLRKKLSNGGGEGDVPVLVSSPSASGLFGAIAFDAANEPSELSFHDMLRLKKEDRPTFSDIDGLKYRSRVGRYEVMPSRLIKVGTTPGQISFVKMAMECALRIGRPIHVFRGLPMPNPAFAVFDFLPPAIEAALRGREFRLEQLPEKITLLRGLEAIAGATGFGVDLALAVADPATRFAAACDALARYEKLADTDQKNVREIGRIVKTMIEERMNMALEGKSPLSPTDNALVAFGHAIAEVQRMRYSSDGDTVPETCIREALDRAEEMMGLGQSARESLIAAIAGNIEKELNRRDLFLPSLKKSEAKKQDALAAAVTIFVDQVWPGAFKGQPPSSRLRRTAIATFRWAFMSESRKRFQERKDKQEELEDANA